ncbi:hypothetical protein LP52_04795 [Streptomonospora alba]|uniref:Uncharacterized protein n=1 Tax=Streptomonospora alba TaxID=183763 RepID=A0A0C2JSL6_9ACTN|nr:hypothetical protein LP52_04795 [Streptomonospora alba]
MVASTTAVEGTPSRTPSGVAWVSTTLPSPSPSMMCMATVRGSGQLNAARTGTPHRPATLKATSATIRSGSASLPDAVSVTRRPTKE